MQSFDPKDDNSVHHRVMRLLARLQCSGCGTRFNPHRFTLIHRSPDGWVLGTDCQHCGKPGMVIVAMAGEAKPEPVTDLVPEEVEAASQWPPLNTNDVLDMHFFLQELGDHLPF